MTPYTENLTDPRLGLSKDQDGSVLTYRPLLEPSLPEEARWTH